MSHSPYRNSVTEGFPPIKKRRQSDSPSRIPTMARNMEVNESTKVHTQSPRLVPGEFERASQPDISTIPPPIAAAAGPTLTPHRPNLDIGTQPSLQTDMQLKDRDSHKVVGALGRRSPPGSAIGRAKAAKKVDEMERTFREATKREPLVSFLPKVAPISSASETSDLKQREEKRIIVTASQGSTSSGTKQEDTHEWFLQQFEKPPSHSSQQARRSVPLMVSIPTESVTTVNPHDCASPAPLENQGEPSSPPRMSEEAVATLEQELEELLTEPDNTLENNEMDVDKLVVDTLVNDRAEKEEPSQPVKQDPHLAEADVDVELLRLVDDQPAPSAIHDNQSQVRDVEQRITFPDSKTIVQPPVDGESTVIHDQAVIRPHEDASIQSPAPPSNDAVLKEENLAEATCVGKKTGKAATSSKKKEGGFKVCVTFSLKHSGPISKTLPSLLNPRLPVQLSRQNQSLLQSRRRRRLRVLQHLLSYLPKQTSCPFHLP